MGRLFIDDIPVSFTEGMTILEAAVNAGIKIPSLCDMPGFRHNASCMVCVVKDMPSARFIPSCASLAVENMRIATFDTDIDQARHEAVSMLAAEHLGDCEAPCTRGCPAGFDIPQIIRLIADGDTGAAAAMILAATPIPETLGIICPAPCERVCRRKHADAPLSIGLLHRFAGHAVNADTQAAGIAAAKNKKILVIGSGPAGLSASFFLARLGYSVTIQEKDAKAGGGLRNALSAHGVSERCLDQEISRLVQSGVQIRAGEPFDFAHTAMSAQEHDAILVAFRIADDNFPDLDTHKNVFFAVHQDKPSKMAVRSGDAGKHAAMVIHTFLETGNPASPPARFDSHMHELDKKELSFFMEQASRENRVQPTLAQSGFSSEEACREAARCLSCDCSKKSSCALRDAADNLCDWKHRYRLETKKRYSRIDSHEEVCYEPGKCIVCGRCIQITEAARELTGLCFIGRGFQVTVAAPMDRPLSEALSKTAIRCVEVCPTGALSLKRKPKKEERK
ncbi:MAG: FAD-binding protein [Spirochaetaceae bacterium]|nr:MAG: FAD-binding protein [Spirochaetaceae bacterium]